MKRRKQHRKKAKGSRKRIKQRTTKVSNTARKPERANIPSSNKVPMNPIRDKAILLGTLILAVILVLYLNSDDSGDVQKDQKILLNNLIIEHESENGPAIVIGNTLDSNLLEELSQLEYAEIKSMMGVTSEFIIYFEDEYGNVIDIGDKPCIGSSHAQVNGRTCG